MIYPKLIFLSVFLLLSNSLQAMRPLGMSPDQLKELQATENRYSPSSSLQAFDRIKETGYPDRLKEHRATENRISPENTCSPIEEAEGFALLKSPTPKPLCTSELVDSSPALPSLPFKSPLAASSSSYPSIPSSENTTLFERIKQSGHIAEQLLLANTMLREDLTKVLAEFWQAQKCNADVIKSLEEKVHPNLLAQPLERNKALCARLKEIEKMIGSTDITREDD